MVAGSVKMMAPGIEPAPQPSGSQLASESGFDDNLIGPRDDSEAPALVEGSREVKAAGLWEAHDL